MKWFRVVIVLYRLVFERFKYWSSNWLLWIRFSVISFSSSGKCQDITLMRSWLLPSKHIPVSYPTIWCYILSISDSVME
jgi:hypothetical protein